MMNEASEETLKAIKIVYLVCFVLCFYLFVVYQITTQNTLFFYYFVLVCL